jgi:peptide deformylase
MFSNASAAALAEAMEEGNMRKFTEKVNIFIKKKWRARYTPYLRVYLLYFFGYLFFFAFRPSPSIHLDIPLVNAAKTAVDHTGIYAHIKSRPIDHIDDHIREISESLQHVIQKHDYECLAAIHISIPMRLIQTKSITLLNPSIVSQGSETSQAYETSAFFPNRPPVLMTRFVPVVLSYQNMDGVDTTLRPNNASLAHCLLHMLNQLDGENIYDQ